MKSPCEFCKGVNTSACCGGSWDEDTERCHTCKEWSENQCAECEDIGEYKKYLEDKE